MFNLTRCAVLNRGKSGHVLHPSSNRRSDKNKHMQSVQQQWKQYTSVHLAVALAGNIPSNASLPNLQTIDY
jgi:hypothetical protein